METLSFDAAPVPVRDDIAATLPRVWARIGEPGSWLTAEQRVAIAAEARNASGCDLCKRSKDALSPYTVKGEHDHLGDLPETWIEVIHRIISDPGRLTEQWFRQVTDGGIKVTEYVELVGVVVCVVGIDTYCRGIGMAPPALPTARAGAPTPDMPEQLNLELAWVPTLDPDFDGPLQKELYPGGVAAHIYRALTYVPSAARNFWAMANTLYMNGAQMRDFDTEYRAISHSQIELVAGRVSAINQCVYWTTSHALLLRASGKHSGSDFDLSAVLGDNSDDSGIANAGLLIEFAEAAVGSDAARLDAARAAVIAEMGGAALSDTAAVAALFNAIDRVADSSGIPLEPEKAEISDEMRTQLGIDKFGQVPAG